MEIEKKLGQLLLVVIRLVGAKTFPLYAMHRELGQPLSISSRASYAAITALRAF